MFVNNKSKKDFTMKITVDITELYIMKMGGLSGAAARTGEL